jgi:hypothetical protein
MQFITDMYECTFHSFSGWYNFCNTSFFFLETASDHLANRRGPPVVRGPQFDKRWCNPNELYWIITINKYFNITCTFLYRLYASRGIYCFCHSQLVATRDCCWTRFLFSHSQIPRFCGTEDQILVTFSVVTYSTTSLTEWRHLSTCVSQTLPMPRPC